MNSSWFPSSAADWLVGTSPQRTLDLSSSPLLARLSAHRGHQVFRAHPAVSDVPGVISVRARADALPFDPSQFDVVSIHQALHTFTPDIALGQIARTLRPNGTLAISYLLRDDAVPWVKRFVALVQSYDPQAMRGDFGADSIRYVAASRYFPDIEHKSFRVWRPVTQQTLIDMVCAQPFMKTLEPDAAEDVKSRVADLYQASSRPIEPLKLPFRLLCWRTQVSHDELTTPMSRPELGLRIKL